MATAIDGTPTDEEKNGTPPEVPYTLKETSPEAGSVEGLDILALATDEHPAHPRHWPVWKKWAILFTLCSFQAFMYEHFIP